MQFGGVALVLRRESAADALRFAVCVQSQVAEIVEHGKTGFLWNTVDELKKYTQLLADDRSLWSAMSAVMASTARM